MNDSKAEDKLFAQIADSGTIPVPERQYKALEKRRFKWDFAWIEQKLLVEIQGGTWVKAQFGHTSGVGYRRDCFKNDLATAVGWNVMQFTTDMVDYKEALQLLQVFFGFADISTVVGMFNNRTRRNKKEKDEQI
jgi:very-short-patch-repair endonuclease